MNFVALQKFEHTLYGFIAVLTLATFLADLFLPLGIAVWVIYLLPVAFAYFAWRQQVPLLLAVVTTAFVILGYQVSPSGIDPQTALINRAFGVVTIWVVAATGYFFIKNKIAIRHQEWLQAGHVALAQKMSGEQRLNQLGENILTFLAEYLGAQAGAIFIQNGDGFRRYATYGAPADPRIPDRIEPSEGLLGQAIKDKRSFRLAEVPDGYLYFGSGLGRAKPRALLIAPAQVDDSVNAVFELGFIGATEDQHIAFLNQISQSIGVAVQSAKYRGRLQEMLEETQRQSEELQTQSEELRASNEELEEQSRSLKETQSRLELQQSELEQTNTQLEEQTRLLETQRDDLARAQTVLKTQAGELEQSSRYKSEFVANMSHELRTPLNSLLILARLLADNRENNLSAEQVKFASTIESSGNDLLLLINDILDISKIESGKLELQMDRIKIAQAVDRLAASFQPLAMQKGITIRTEIATDVPDEIESDTQRLDQILKNFVSNAVKFTERGEVVLGVRRTSDGYLAFTVRDTGIGIPADQQQTIFDAFRQADGTINRKYGGTGLGLSISRELARLLGGHIEVESSAGHGSTFTLVVPKVYDVRNTERSDAGGLGGLVTKAANRLSAPGGSRGPQQNITTATAPARPRHLEDDRSQLSGNSRIILVVEDDPAFARILYDLAHELGFQCLLADTAEDGVMAARQYLPHAMILDMGLPDHTGLSVLDRVKRDVRTRHIPVHVVSVSDYTQAAMAFGAAGYMLKPVKRERLIQALEGLERHLPERVRRVLIVEDNADQLESLRSLLASRDVDTIGAQTAAACLEALKQQTFDCLVLDLSLPDASGFDVLEELRQNDTFSFPPVIVYTGRDLSPDEELRLRKYSKSIIIKGAKSPERLLDEVTLFLHQVVSELPERQQKMLAQSMSRDAAIEGRRILVVEDDVRNVFSLTSILEPHGAIVPIARNGREALAALERASLDGEVPIDMVLMDIMMPEMDGLTATREIRKRPEWKNLPVIALTAKARPEDQEQCLAAGANDYLAKPLDIDKLLSLIRVWMPR